MNNDNEEPTTYALISYRNAVKYFDNALILCNNITEIDEFLFENCALCNAEQDYYQYFLTDCSQDDAEKLNKWFGLNFLYSKKLDLYILAVEHCGTSWDHVPCNVYDKFVADYIKNNGLEFKH
jgi:hypothetical protein